MAKVHPGPFEALTELARRTPTHRDPVLEDVVSDMRFYEACLDCIDPLKAAGLPVCFPEVTTESGGFAVQDEPIRTQSGRQDDHGPHVRAASPSCRDWLPDPRSPGARDAVRSGLHALRA